MSFIRPSLAKVLHIYSEAIIFGMLALGTLVTVLVLAPESNWILITAVALFGLTFAIAAVNAFLRARIAGDGNAQGVVIIDEHRIGYFAPENGGFVELSQVTRIELINKEWRVHHLSGAPVHIPINAPKAVDLVDVFSTLPGISLLTLHAAMTSDAETPELVWARPN